MPKSKEYVSSDGSSSCSSSSSRGSSPEPTPKRKREEKKKPAREEKEEKAEKAEASNKHSKSSKPSKTSKEEEKEPRWDLGKNRFITVRDFKGMTLIDIREMYNKDGEMMPGKKGIALSPDQWKKLVENIDEVNKVIKSK